MAELAVVHERSSGVARDPLVAEQQRAHAQVKLAKANGDRAQRLLDQNAISREEYDRILTAAASAAAFPSTAAAHSFGRMYNLPVPFWMYAYGAAAALLQQLARHVEEPPSVEHRRPLKTEIWEGLSFVLRQSLLRRIVLCTMLSNLAASISSVLLVLYVIRDLGLTEATLGLVFSVGSVGGLLAALTVTRIARVVGEGRTIPLMALLTVATPGPTVLLSLRHGGDGK